MNAFDRHLTRQLLLAVVFVTVSLSGVLWLSQSLRFVDLIINRGLSTGTFFHLIMLLLPNFIIVILPIAAFAATVFTYSRLINDREIMVLSAAGMSPLGIGKSAIIVAVVLTVAGYALYFSVVPTSARLFRELQWDIRYNYSQVLLEEGMFSDVSAGITVYVRQRSSDGQLRGILVHDKRQDDKPYTLMAERGALVGSDQGARVVLFNGSRQEFDKKTHSFSVLYFERYAFDLEKARQDNLTRYRDQRERTLFELLTVRSDPNVPERDYGQFLVEAHRRLTSPLNSLGYTLIGLSCLLAGGFRRRGQAPHTVVAVAIVAALALGQMGLENVTARNLELVPVLYALALLPVAGGVLVLVWMPRPGLWRRPNPAAEPA